MKVDANGLSNAILDELNNFASLCDDEITKAAEDGAKVGKEIVKSAGGYKDDTGAYRKSISVRKNGKGYVIYAKSPHYRLTHLLERGHAKAGGGRTRAFPHWAPGEKVATTEFEKSLRRRIEKQ